MLISHGYHPERTTCISEAIQKSVEHLYQIILCNYHLEDCDAFQAYNLFENSILKSATPFVVIVKDKSFEVLELGLELGVDNFIFLPYEDQIILRKIKLLLRKVKEQKALEVK